MKNHIRYLSDLHLEFIEPNKIEVVVELMARFDIDKKCLSVIGEFQLQQENGGIVLV